MSNKILKCSLSVGYISCFSKDRNNPPTLRKIYSNRSISLNRSTDAFCGSLVARIKF